VHHWHASPGCDDRVAVAEGRTPTDIVANYPQLVVDGVRAAFAYATVRERERPLRTGV